MKKSQKTDGITGRITLVAIAGLIYSFALLAMLFSMQVLRGAEYSAKVQQQSASMVVNRPRRGMVLDRKSRVLARSVDRKVPITVQKENPRQPVVHVNRVYHYGPVAAPLIGWTGTDRGWGGIESRFNSFISGEEGYQYQNVDGLQRRYTTLGSRSSSVIHGADVHLTIDIDLQEQVEAVLKSTVEKWEAQQALAVVMNPHTGDILAMASSTGFNPNYWWEYTGVDRQNLPISANYEPGSTYKVMTLAAAMQEGLVTPDDSIDVYGGVYEIYGELIQDHVRKDRVSIPYALWFSSNVAFSKMGVELGRERMYRYLRDFGFGARTGIDLPGEEQGLVRTPNQWSGRTEATIAFGHEFTGTLLQVVSAFSVIANGGELIRPRVVTKVTGANGEILNTYDREVVRRVITPEVALEIRRMMEGVLTYGTGRSIDFSLAPMAGKTGTSEKIDPETGRYSKDKVLASFVAMVPVENPRLVVGVFVDEPKGAAPGGRAAGPAVAEIFRKIALTPDMDYGLLDHQGAMYERTVDRGRYPDLSGLGRLEVARICGAAGLTFSYVGDGELVTHQTPPAGTRVLDNTPLLLYTNGGMTPGNSRIVMPSVVGQSMKDAINSLSLNGLVPYFEGAGTVIRQTPTAGTVLTGNQVCTLFCEVIR